MIQLALETTGKSGSLAVLDGENILLKRRLGIRLRTAAELAVELESVFQWCEDESCKIQSIAVAVGPGSFTGLRIAVTTAKTLAYAWQLPVVSVGSLAAIAAVTVTMHPVANLLVGLNAYRRQVFAAEFALHELQTSDGISRCNHRAVVLSRSEWDQRVAQAIEQPDWAVTGEDAIFASQGSVPAPELSNDTPSKLSGTLAARDEPDAVGVGRIAARWIAAAESSRTKRPANALDSASLSSPFTDPFALVPRYLRPSAAEEKATTR